MNRGMAVVRPFLKWAGSKYQLLERIKQSLPTAKRLIEPFVGSGAVFLNTDYPRYLLTDTNADLIGLYRYIQKEGASFIDYCESWFINRNTRDDYYHLRELFNTATDTRLRAALFIYLNRHGFNGLCRYNLKGQYNVPFGQYKKPYFPRAELIHFHQKAQRATFKQMDFKATMQLAKPGDVFYCDPPYVPLSKTANFTSYSANRFGMDEQIALARQAELLADKGIVVLISNHRTPLVKQLYARAKFRHFKVRRSISCQGNARGKASEILAIFAPVELT